MKTILFVILPLLIGSTLAAPAPTVTQPSTTNSTKNWFGVIFDAGSSKIELILFRWPAQKVNNTGKVVQFYTGERLPPVDNLNDESLAKITTALKGIESKIDSTFDENLPVFVGATAGLRMLQLRLPNKTDSVLNLLKTGLSQTKINNKPVDIRGVKILTGADEGLFAWVTAKYLVSFHKSTEPSKKVAMIDMGGASAQLAYETPGHTGNEVNLFGHHFDVHSESNLCYGSDQGLRRHQFLIMAEKNAAQPEKETYHDPCLPKDKTRKLKVSLFRENPCLKGKHDDFLTKIPTTGEFTVVGTGDAKQCSERYGKYLTKEHCEANFRKDLCFTVDEAPKNMSIYATSTYFFMFKNWQVYKKDNKATNLSMVQARTEIDQFCSRNDLNESEFDYCAKMNFVYYYLTNVYKIDAETFNHIHFIRTLHGIDIGWPLGYMFNETNYIPKVKTADGQ